MPVTLAIPTYNNFGGLHECVWSAQTGFVKPDRILIINNSGQICPAIPGTEIITGRQPQSVAKAWNDAAQLAGGDWLIIANDDIVFAPDTIALLLAEVERNDNAGIVSPIEGARFACFLLRWACYQDVGAFDEAFQMAYFEDNDFGYRLIRKGWQSAVAPSNVRHAGSTTIAKMTPAQLAAKHAAYQNNELYFQRKWGGVPHQERFTEPFGGREL